MLKRCAFVPFFLFLIIAAATSAQDELPPGQADAPASYSAAIDLEKMLDGTVVLPTSSQTDGVWLVELVPGKRIVRIPFMIATGEKEFELSTSDLKMRRGRFIAWQLLSDDEKVSSQKVPLASVTATSSTGLPAGVPRFARKITIKPDGTVHWKMERSIIGAKSVKPSGATSHPYALKMDRTELERLEPAKPPKSAPPADPKARAEFARAKRAAEAAYRQRLSEYSRLTRAISKLPDEFSGKKPNVLWAVFELPSSVDVIELEGPTPLPWNISVRLLTQIQGMSKGGGKPEENNAFAGTLLAAVKTGGKVHPFTLRLVAGAMVAAKLLKDIEENTPAYEVASVVLGSKDQIATAALIDRLSMLQSDAAKKLFKTAVTGTVLSSDSKLAALVNLLSAAVAKTEDHMRRVQTANEFLADANGPDPAGIIKAVLELGAKDAKTKGMLETDMKFDSLSEARLTPAINAIVAAAPSNDLARSWFRSKLLDPNNATISSATLNRVSSVALPERIPVASADHNLFGFLEHVDSKVRNQAWQAMSNVEMTDVASTATWPETLSGAALRYDQTPKRLVPFLNRHKVSGVGDSLARIVLFGDDEAATAASKQLLKSDIAIDSLIDRMPTLGDRFAFAQRLYELRYKSSPLVTYLLREKSKDSIVAKWFGQQLKNGSLPAPGEWAKAFGDQKMLLEFMASNDKDLALGGLAALFATVGGTDEQVIAALPKFQAKKDSIQDLLQLWEATKQETFTQRLAALKGKHELIINIAATDDQPAASKSLGRFNVSVEGAAVTIGPIQASIPQDSTLAVRIKVGDLTRFPAAGVSTADGVKFIDLKPRDAGSWGGEFLLEGGNTGSMVLKP